MKGRFLFDLHFAVNRNISVVILNLLAIYIALYYHIYLVALMLPLLFQYNNYNYCNYILF